MEDLDISKWLNQYCNIDNNVLDAARILYNIKYCK